MPPKPRQRARQTETDRAREALSEAAAEEQASAEQLRRLDVLERALEFRAADQAMAAAQADVEKERTAANAAGGGES